jgi:hypothetical protein
MSTATINSETASDEDFWHLAAKKIPYNVEMLGWEDSGLGSFIFTGFQFSPAVQAIVPPEPIQFFRGNPACLLFDGFGHVIAQKNRIFFFIMW